MVFNVPEASAVAQAVVLAVASRVVLVLRDARPPARGAKDRVARTLNAGRRTADVGLVLRILVAVLFGFVCLSSLGWAALYLFTLRREGATWSYQTRLWVRLKAAEYALIAVLILVAAADLGRRWTVVVAFALLALLILRTVVGRRAKRSPGWINET